MNYKQSSFHGEVFMSELIHFPITFGDVASFLFSKDLILKDGLEK